MEFLRRLVVRTGVDAGVPRSSGPGGSDPRAAEQGGRGRRAAPVPGARGGLRARRGPVRADCPLPPKPVPCSEEKQDVTNLLTCRIVRWTTHVAAVAVFSVQDGALGRALALEAGPGRCWRPRAEGGRAARSVPGARGQLPGPPEPTLPGGLGATVAPAPVSFRDSDPGAVWGRTTAFMCKDFVPQEGKAAVLRDGLTQSSSRPKRDTVSWSRRPEAPRPEQTACAEARRPRCPAGWLPGLARMGKGGTKGAVKNDRGLRVRRSRCELGRTGQHAASRGQGQARSTARTLGGHWPGQGGSQHPVPEAAGHPWNGKARWAVRGEGPQARP